MQIILDSIDELKQLADLIYRGQTTTAVSIGAEVRGANLAPVVSCRLADEGTPIRFRTGAPIVADAAALAVSIKAAPAASDAAPTVDSTGRPWDERIDSSNRGTNADGTWRARRGVAPETRAAVLAELAELLEANGSKGGEPETYAEPGSDAAVAEPEPSATERHPLPGAAEVAPSATVPSATVPSATVPSAATPTAEDLAALVEAVEAVAQDLEGGMMDTLNACKAFTAEHGVAAFNAVKNAVAPSENGQGTPVNLLTPAQRRTLQAAVQTYDAYFAGETGGDA